LSGKPIRLIVVAPSRITLANLSVQRLLRLFLHHAQEIAAAGLDGNWLALRDKIKAMALLGHAVASDIDKALVGAAFRRKRPAFQPDRRART